MELLNDSILRRKGRAEKPWTVVKSESPKPACALFGLMYPTPTLLQYYVKVNVGGISFMGGIYKSLSPNLDQVVTHT